MTLNADNDDEFEQFFMNTLRSEWDERLKEIYDNLCSQISDMICSGQYKKTIGTSAGYDINFMNYAKKYIESKTKGIFKCEISRGSTHKIISLIAELQNFDNIVEKL